MQSKNFRYVRWSLLIVENLFENNKIEKNNINRYITKIFINHARYNQILPWRHLSSKYWNIRDKIFQILRIFFITKLFKDKLSLIAEFIFPERNLLKINGEYNNIFSLISLRIIQLRNRLK